MDALCEGYVDQEQYEVMLRYLLVMYKENNELSGLQLESSYTTMLILQNLAGILSFVIGFTMLMHH